MPLLLKIFISLVLVYFVLFLFALAKASKLGREIEDAKRESEEKRT